MQKKRYFLYSQSGCDAHRQIFHNQYGQRQTHRDEYQNGHDGQKLEAPAPQRIDEQRRQHVQLHVDGQVPGVAHALYIYKVPFTCKTNQKDRTKKLLPHHLLRIHVVLHVQQRRPPVVLARNVCRVHVQIPQWSVAKVADQRGAQQDGGRQRRRQSDVAMQV